MLTLNGLEFDIDFTDADVQETYAKACKVLEPLAKPEEGLTNAQMIRKSTSAVRAFLDLILGDGAGEKVLPKDSMSAAAAIVQGLVKEAQRQMDDVGQLAVSIQK